MSNEIVTFLWQKKSPYPLSKLRSRFVCQWIVWLTQTSYTTQAHRATTTTTTAAAARWNIGGIRTRQPWGGWSDSARTHSHWATRSAVRRSSSSKSVQIWFVHRLYLFSILTNIISVYKRIFRLRWRG